MISKKHEKGFSLVEVVLVVAIAGLIGLMIGNLPSSAKLVGNSRYESIAKEISSKSIEELRSITYDNLANGTTSISDPRLSSLPNGSGEVTVNDCPVEICTENEQSKLVTVEINWTDAGSARNVRLDTLVSKGGLQ